MKPSPSSVRTRKFKLSQDIMARSLLAENGRLRKENAELKEQLSAVERYNKGALAALWGEKPVRESEKVRPIVKLPQS